MLKFNETKINFGQLRYGEVAHHDILVTNDTETDIVISTHASCGSCTTIHTFPNPIKGKSTSTAQVSIDTKKAGSGQLTKTVKLTWHHKGVNYSEIFTFKLDVSRS